MTIEILAVAVAAYLLGSVPFGLLLTRAAGLGDIRKVGSGNIGATNVLRTGRKALAAATLVLDGSKGAVAVLLAAALFGPFAAAIAAAAAVTGHIFPVWLGFRGGKGVATVLGVWLALVWPIGLIACGLWLITAQFFRYSSLAALVAIGATPLLALGLGTQVQCLVAALLAVLVFWRHEANIRRLIAGNEPRIGASKL